MIAKTASVVTLLVVLLNSANASAEELRAKVIDHETANHGGNIGQEGHYAGSFGREGVAIFENGEVADYSHGGTYTFKGTKGTYIGFATARFTDGSTIVKRYEGEEIAGKLVGTGKILEGTGRFAGVTGTESHNCARETKAAEEGSTIMTCQIAWTLNRP